MVPRRTGTIAVAGYSREMNILADGRVIAKHIKASTLRVPGLTFFSDDLDGVQVGIWNYDAGKILNPHIHNLLQKTSERTSEVLYVISGSIHADIYDDKANLVSEFEVLNGDILICLAGGHGYRVLEPHTLVLEVKNGPYFGPDLDRRRIETECSI